MLVALSAQKVPIESLFEESNKDWQKTLLCMTQSSRLTWRKKIIRMEKNGWERSSWDHHFSEADSHFLPLLFFEFFFFYLNKVFSHNFGAKFGLSSSSGGEETALKSSTLGKFRAKTKEIDMEMQELRGAISSVGKPNRQLLRMKIVLSGLKSYLFRPLLLPAKRLNRLWSTASCSRLSTLKCEKIH